MNGQFAIPSNSRYDAGGLAADYPDLIDYEERDRLNRRLARLAIIGTSVGLQQAYLAPAFAVQHILYGLAGTSALAAFIMGGNKVWSRHLLGILTWYYCAVLISAALSPYRAVVLGMTWKPTLYHTVGVLSGMAVANSQVSLRKLTRLMVLTALGSAILAAIQATTGKFYFLAASEISSEHAQESAAATGRAFGFFGNPNGMANWLMIPIGVCLARLAYPPKEGAGWRPIVWLPILLGGMGLTISRSGIAATCLIVGLVLGRRVFRPKVLIGAAASLMVSAASIRLLAPAFFDYILERMMNVGEDKGRTHLINVALNAAFERPLIGMGPRSFQILSGDLVAHNGFLEPFVELGVFGYVPVMLGLGCGIMFIWRAALLAKDSDYEWMWRGWAAGLTAFVLSAMVHGSGWRSTVLWSFLSIAYTGHALLIRRHNARISGAV